MADGLLWGVCKQINLSLLGVQAANTCSWKSLRWTQRSCPQRFPLPGSSSLCSTDQGQSLPSPGISEPASSSACQGPDEPYFFYEASVSELQICTYQDDSLKTRISKCHLSAKTSWNGLAASHRLLPLAAHYDCLDCLHATAWFFSKWHFWLFCLCLCLLKLAAVLLFGAGTFQIPSVFPFLLPSPTGSCAHDKYMKNAWKIQFSKFESHTIPILVILSCHIRAIVYQELYDITMALPVAFLY